MAIQDDSLTGAEHDWFATRSGLGNVPLNDHKREYFSTKGFRSNASLSRPLSQLEREWLQSVSGTSSNNEGDLWIEVVSASGFTPAITTSQNKFIFYTSETGSP